MILTTKGVRISDTRDFVLSTENPDRIGDVILMDGLDTKQFEKNPIALFMHNHSSPVGVWQNLHKKHGALFGSLLLAGEGTSKLVDFTRKMIAQGVLRATSVSVLPKQVERRADGKGRVIKESELLEVSIVTIPMNADALMIAKSLDFSDNEIENLFQKPVNCDATEILHRARLNIIAAKRTAR